MTKPRGLAVRLVLVLLRWTAWVLSRSLPRSRTVVIAASPEHEGNAVETASALLSRYEGRVIWLRGSCPAPASVRGLHAAGMVLVPKASARGLWAYARAEAVLFTHGLYGSPLPARRKPVVNLWHGDGPKDSRPGKGGGALIRSTYLVGNTRLFTGYLADCFRVPEHNVVLTGNPRTDGLWRPIPASARSRLGLPERFVVWMPTFRRARAWGATAAYLGSNSPSGSGPEEGRWLTVLSAGLRERGFGLVIKPHPLDSEVRARTDALTLTDDDLDQAGVQLYELLGGAAGLVSDYSSVWVDFLLTDRPIAFLASDRASYGRRLYPEDVLEWVPGELVGEEAPFSEFFADLDSGGRLGRASRAAARCRIGLNATRTAAHDLLDHLGTQGVLPLRARS